MNEASKVVPTGKIDDVTRPQYESPTVRVMSETEVLSAFQVTAAGTSMWWGM